MLQQGGRCCNRAGCGQDYGTTGSRLRCKRVHAMRKTTYLDTTSLHAILCATPTPCPTHTTHLHEKVASKTTPGAFVHVTSHAKSAHGVGGAGAASSNTIQLRHELSFMLSFMLSYICISTCRIIHLCRCPRTCRGKGLSLREGNTPDNPRCWVTFPATLNLNVPTTTFQAQICKRATKYLQSPRPQKKQE